MRSIATSLDAHVQSVAAEVWTTPGELLIGSVNDDDIVGICLLQYCVITLHGKDEHRSTIV